MKSIICIFFIIGVIATILMIMATAYFTFEALIQFLDLISDIDSLKERVQKLEKRED